MERNRGKWLQESLEVRDRWTEIKLEIWMKQSRGFSEVCVSLVS